MQKLSRSVKDHQATPEEFWERAGQLGYGDAVFRSPRVQRHVIGRQWRIAIEIAEALGLNSHSVALELGCGDGVFTNTMLAPRCAHVTATDYAHGAILRARAECQHSNVEFFEADATTYDYAQGQHWDMAFLIGFLHHVKPHTPAIVRRLARVAPRVVVLEPIGDNPIRKLLEKTPAYQEAGEASFTLAELSAIFGAAGYRLTMQRRINLFPPFTPDLLYWPMRAAEGVVENLPPLNRLCSTYMLGFVRPDA